MTSSQVNVSDTKIVAPFAGKIDTNTLAEGEFVTANSTVLTTLSNSDPMRVRFSVSESDYLDMLKGNTDNGNQLRDITLTLADGSTYAYKGYVDQVDRSVSDSTGTLTLKALFQNPDHLLLVCLPMFPLWVRRNLEPSLFLSGLLRICSISIMSMSSMLTTAFL